MKRILFIIIALALKSSLYAQDDYRPFVEEGKTWSFVVEATSFWWDGKESHWDTDYENSTLTIKGDTVVDGIEYKKVMYTSDNNFFNDIPNFIYGIIREENKKVYMRSFFYDCYYPDYLSEEVLMYDFNLKVGDSFTEDYGSDYYRLNMKLESIEENEGRRIYKFSTNKDWVPVMQWVEGAGGFHGLGMEQRIPITTCIECIHFKFFSMTCSLGDEVLCRFDDDGNVVLGVEEVRTDVNKDKSVYDLQGRKLSAEPSHGIYIKDGKKIAR